MNEDLKARHMARIRTEEGRMVYDTLCAACDKRDGGMTDADQMLICDVAVCEDMKMELLADIEKRGIGGEHRNGRQTYWQENKSLASLKAYCDQQRKHLAELRMTPSSKKAEQITVESDEFAAF